MSDMENRLQRLETATTELRPLLVEIRDYLKGIANEMQGLRRDSKGFDEKMSLATDEMRGIRQDIHEFEKNFVELRGKVDALPTQWGILGGVAALLALALLILEFAKRI